MSISYIFGKLTAAEKIQLKFAAAIIAADEEEQVQIFKGSCYGNIVVVELGPNQVLFEGPELYELGKLVKHLKGSCLLNLDQPPAPGDESKPVSKHRLLTAKDKAELPFDEEDPANWWRKNGGDV